MAVKKSKRVENPFDPESLSGALDDAIRAGHLKDCNGVLKLTPKGEKYTKKLIRDDAGAQAFYFALVWNSIVGDFQTHNNIWRFAFALSKLRDEVPEMADALLDHVSNDTRDVKRLSTQCWYIDGVPKPVRRPDDDMAFR